MSLVIAIKDKNRIVLGADKQSSTCSTKDHAATKIWEVDGLPGAIMGGVGSMRASQIIQYNKIVDLNDVAEKGMIDTDFIVNSLVPVIVAQLRTHGVGLTPEEGEDKEVACAMIPNVFLFAYGDKAWMIWHDLSVTELGDHLAIGSGSDVANGALFATPEKNPFERIVTCIDAAAESTLYVDDGVDLLATKYYKTDAKSIAKALGMEGELQQALQQLASGEEEVEVEVREKSKTKNKPKTVKEPEEKIKKEKVKNEK